MVEAEASEEEIEEAEVVSGVVIEEDLEVDSEEEIVVDSEEETVVDSEEETVVDSEEDPEDVETKFRFNLRYIKRNLQITSSPLEIYIQLET